MKQTYNNLWAYHLTDEGASRTCGYRYTVTADHMAHTAFGCRRGLDLWLGERGLVLTGAMPAKGDHAPIGGRYHTESHMDRERFESIREIGSATRTVSNGDWVDAIVTVDPENGERTVHHLNPNVRDRATYPHDECRTLYGSGYCQA